MSQTRNTIHLHIEQLSLPGYTPAERRAFIAALERELAGIAGTTQGRELPGGNRNTLQITTASPLPAAQAAAIGRLLKPDPGKAKNPPSPIRPPGTEKSR